MEDEVDLTESYKQEPMYIYGHKVLDRIQEYLEIALNKISNKNLKVRIQGEAEKKILILLKYQIIDDYHNIAKKQD